MPAPERWLVVTARVPGDDPLRDLISEALLAVGGLSVLEERDGLTIYLPEPPGTVERFLAKTSRFIRDWIADEPPELIWRWQSNEDWEREWKRGLQPRKVSRRFVVKPSWTKWSTAADEIVIEIDPQMAFGTGEHPTTRGCLRLLDAALLGGERVLDVGAGSGILSIAAARGGASHVVAVELDPDANLNARENIARNGVEASIELHERMADPELLSSLGTFDLIVANILSGVIRPLLPAFATSLEPEGRLIVSGILQEEAEDVLGDARLAGLDLLAEDREGEWWSGILRHGV